MTGKRKNKKFFPSDIKPPKLPIVRVDIPKIYPPKFKPSEERLVRVTTLARRPLTTRQVSQFSGISYNSTKNNLDKLKNKGIIKKKELKNRIYWFI